VSTAHRAALGSPVPAAAPAQAGRVVARFGQRFIVALDSAGADAGASGGASDGVPAGAPEGSAAPGEVDAIARGRRQEVVVGDRVRCTREAEFFVIESVDERRNLLFRADENRIKPLAANVDQIAVVFAAQPPPQAEFVWRAMLAAQAAGVGSLAVLNKVDLESGAELAALAEIDRIGARVVRVSARTDPEGTRARLEQECRGRVTLFVGQSGMGKSTLLNLLIGAQLRTGALSRRGTHGRQTTTATRWFSYGADGAVIDSPGFHEFGLAHLAPADLTRWLPEFAAVTQACRFADCHHAEEPGCAIRAALAAGAISPGRYAFYRKLLAQDGGSGGGKQRR